tara:strand:+ start:854 stop:1117 length:264 start_codon:yes stop_codon:yes gene_type:complete
LKKKRSRRLKISQKLDIKQSVKKEQARQKRKSSAITDGHQVTGMEKLRTQGKGDKNRLGDWYSQETTDRLNEIFGKKKKENSETEGS